MKPPIRLNLVLGLLFIVVFFLVLNFTVLGDKVKNFFYLVSSPLQQGFWKAGDATSDFLTGVFQAENLKKEADELYLKSRSLIARIAELKELENENLALREALQLGLQKEMELNLSRIISKDISGEIVLINKGGKDGMAEGYPVITPQKLLLGKITKVYDDFSEVMLITNRDSSFDARVLGKDIYGAVKGGGDSALYLDLVPKDKELSSGDIVVTAALGGDFPAGIVVGSVREVRKTDIEPFQAAEIIPSFDLKAADIIFVIVDF